MLVIDADGQRGDRSGAAAGNADVGLSEVLLDAVKWTDAIVDVGHPQADVRLLGPGRQAASRAAGHRFPMLVNEIRPSFRYILIDGGLAGAGSLAAAGECCDLAYLVLGLDQTDWGDAVEAASALRNAGVDVRGCIATYAS